MHSRMQRLGGRLTPTSKDGKVGRYCAVGYARPDRWRNGLDLGGGGIFPRQWVQGHSVCCRHSAGQARKGRCIGKVGADIKLVSDSLDTIKAIAERSPDSALLFRILIEVDSGEGRAGVLADDPVFLEMARVINDASNMKLMGVMTHAGHSYGCETVDAIKDVAAQERERITSAAERARRPPAPL